MLRLKAVDRVGVGLVFSKRIPHEQVRALIARFVKESGGRLDERGKEGKTLISDESPNKKIIPVTTGADFTLTGVALVRDNAPVLTPFVRALQAYDNVQILFGVSELNPYRGVERFETPALTVQMEKGMGAYTYNVTIRDHAAAIPDLKAAPKSETPDQPVVKPKPQKTLRLVALALIVAGAGTLGGAGLYFLVTRRAS